MNKKKVVINLLIGLFLSFFGVSFFIGTIKSTKKNILVRKLNAYNMDNCVRITIGTELQNKTLLKFTKKFLKEIL